MTAHKSGFVNIIGNPNAGKSTLMNAMLGEKLSIITPKAQTTRHRIKGILNAEEYQIVFSDTPGIIKPGYKLHENMMGFVNTAIGDADIIVLVIDVSETRKPEEDALARVKKATVPVLIVINKVDASQEERLEAVVTEWKTLFPDAEILPASALRKFNTDRLLKRIVELLPESPPYFDKEDISDKPVKFFVAEIIREKILLYYQQEIPYACEVIVDEYKEGPKLDKIRVSICVERDSQKGILIGKEGKALKKLGTTARKDIEAFLGKQVFLEMHVKVEKDWRNDPGKLRRLGYQE